MAYRMPFANLYETLVASQARFPNKDALADAQRTVSYTVLKEETDAMASYLAHKCGIGKGDRVALSMVNSIPFCVSFYAVMKLGATVVSINTKLSADEMEFILRDSDAVCLIADRKWYERVQERLPKTRIAHILITENTPPRGLVSYQEVIAAGKKLESIPVVTDDTLPAEIMYTSGTTGRPKGAVMTQFNLLQGMYSYAILNDMDDEESTVLPVPIFHITGLNCVLTLFVFLGGFIVMMPFFDAVDVLDKMTAYRVTHIHAVATVFIMLESAMLERHDLSSLKTALCGGGFMTRETVSRFCRKAPNCAFHPVYGMTETSGAGTYFPEHCLDSEIKDSCGIVSPNCEIRVVDENDIEVPNGQNGEICFRGAFIIDSYLHGKGNENIQNGWLHSGDVGCFNEDGYLFIHDRIKDMINRGGEKVFSLAVEDVIMSFGGIKQAAVFAVDDSLYGEVPGAVVLSEPGVETDMEALREYLRAHLAHYKVPVYMEHRESLPTTANGKVRKFLLRQEFNQKYAQ